MPSVEQTTHAFGVFLVAAIATLVVVALMKYWYAPGVVNFAVQMTVILGALVAIAWLIGRFA